ncbi:MAG: hypothetical protein OXJ90_08460 [Spirochaetaceae bacterium]|nr:hypothetical protein [Spirochaetaceae bacterium]
MSNEDQGIVYGNIGVLTFARRMGRRCGESGVIGNLGLLLHGPDNAALVNTLSAGNLGCTVKAPAHDKLEMVPVRWMPRLCASGPNRSGWSSWVRSSARRTWCQH